jgi:hypothetical protein
MQKESIMKSTYLVGALLLANTAGLVGCVGSDPSPEPALATLAATAASNALGVTSWEVRADGDAVRIVGRDDGLERRAELMVSQDPVAPSERVKVDVVFPQRGTFEVARGGAVDGASTSFLAQVGAAINADLAEHTVQLDPREDPDLGAAVSAIFLQGEGHIDMGWSVFGYSANIDVNTWCQQGTRDSFDAYSNNGASCWVNRWTSNSPYDCRINLHYGITGFRTDTCNWFVYTNP